MVRVFLRCSILFANASIAGEARACACADDSIEDSVRTADRIFEGRVLSAHVSDSKPEVIRFVVEVREGLRGEAGERVSLETTLPEHCGIEIRPGFHDLYVLHTGESTVDSCSGSGRVASERVPLLSFAVALTSYGEGQSGRAIAFLRRAFYVDYPRDELDRFFALVERIDPAGRHVARDGVSARFGDVRFTFRNDKLLSIGAVQ